MKKFQDSNERNLLEFFSKKTFRVMKLTLFLSMLTIIQLWATETYSQMTKLSLKIENTRIADVLKEIENKSEFYFLYSPKLINVEKTVYITADKEPIKEILTEMFGETVSFFVYDRQIILMPRNPSEYITVLQQKKVTGKVTDKTGAPLPGVSVTIKGTLAGTLTDADGSFSCDVPANKEILVFSFIGMASQEVSIGNQTYFNIVLEEYSVSLDEVVVIGYGTQVKRNVTGSVSIAKESDLHVSTSSNFLMALQGIVPGLEALQNTGQPGANVKVQIRTNPSNASSGVLYVLDGIPINDDANDPGSSTKYGSSGVDRSLLNFVNPNDIESIQFLKDASAASIYGARAGAGVILITTKSGKSGQQKIDYTVSYAFQSPDRLYKLLDTKDFMKQRNMILFEAYLRDNKIDPYGNVDPLTISPFVPKYSEAQISALPLQESAIEAITRNGFTQQHNLSLSGGNDKTTYFVSGNYFKQKGIVIASDYVRYNSRINVVQKISDHIKVGVNVSSSNSIAGNSNTGGANEYGGIFPAAFYFQPITPLLNPDGSYPINPEYPNIPNPLSYATVTDQTKYHKLITTGYLEWIILPDLKAKANLSYNQSGSIRSVYEPKTFLYGNQANGVASKNSSNTDVELMEYTLNYIHQFGEKHSLNLLGGYSYQVTNWEGYNAGNRNFFTDNFLFNNLGVGQAITPNVGSFKSQLTWISYFSRVSYTLNDKYTLQVSLRKDGSSVFAENKKYGVFPSVSGGWLLSKENFLKELSFLNYLKLRVGYGTTGNSNIGGSATAFYSAGYNYVFGTNTQNTGVQLSQLNNDNLTWETQGEINVGLEFGLLKDRIIGSIDYFNRTISGLLTYVPLPSDYLVSGVFENSGKTRATGWEIALKSNNIISVDPKGFQWETSLTFSHYYSYWLERSPNSLKTLPKYIEISGRNAPYNGIYGYLSEGIYKNADATPPNQMGDMLPGGIIIRDIHGYDGNGNLTDPDSKVTAADQTLIGSYDPKFSFGITNNFRFKSFDLSIYFSGVNQVKWSPSQYGANIEGSMSFGQNTLAVSKQRWTYLNPNSSFPTGLTDANYNQFQHGSDFWIVDASYLRCRNITLGFNVPENIIQKQKVISSLRLSVEGQNLFTITAYPEIDPEINPNNYYPLTKGIVIGINATF